MISKSSPLVSIIIPVYNGANYLAEAIDSALAQTYPNIEVIVVNDGSNDGGATESIALSYGDRIRYFRKENGGVATALNLGIEQMRGDFFSWLSHDDIYLPDKTAQQVSHLIHTDKPERILWGDYEVVDEKGGVLESCPTDQSKTLRKFYSIFYGRINGCTVLVPKRCFEEVGNFDPRYRTTQDYDLWYRMAKKYEFEHLPGAFVRYRLHSSQDTQRRSDLYRQEALDLYLRFMKALSEEEILSLEDRPSLFYMNMAERFRTMLPEVSFFALQEFKKAASHEFAYIGENLCLLLKFHFSPIYVRLRGKLRMIKKRMLSGRGGARS